jgi:hypothetical protein
MKPEADPPRCPSCGEPVNNRDSATITPMGLFHDGCSKPEL